LEGVVETTEYEKLARQEREYWWHRSRAHVLRQLVHAHCRDCRLVLDAGCGTGGNIDWLSTKATVVAADTSHEALRLLSIRRPERLVASDVEHQPWPDATFDLILMADVLEHVDDRTALAEAFRILRPGGILVATVPAYKLLWSDHDVALHHKRRYTKALLTARVRTAGFEIRLASYLFMVALLPALLARTVWMLSRRLQSERPPPATLRPSLPKVVNDVLVLAHRGEAALLQRTSLPFGLSVACVAAKPHTLNV
jgi:SAM-dependent methyltransferase